MRRQSILWAAVAAVLILPAGEAIAQGRVRLEILTQERAPVTAQQDWLRALAQAGVEDVRISSDAMSAKIGIKTEGTPDNPVYVVTAVLLSSGDLRLPGTTYRVREAAQAAKWLQEVAAKGPPEKREPTTSTGLTASQFKSAHQALAAPTGFATKGMDRAEAVRKLAGQVPVPVRLDPSLLKSASGDPVAEELKEVASGAALAYLLRPAGLSLLAKPGAMGTELVVVRAEPGLEIWPIGWEAVEPPPKVLPTLFQTFNANLDNVPLATALDAVAGRLKAPILLDHSALARRGIDPQKTLVNFPQAKVTYNSLLWKVLSQAKLRMELRIDEAGKPLVWVSTQQGM